jgi:hypothetical protein
MESTYINVINKIVEKVGQKKFDEVILRIYSAGTISEVNFDEEIIDNVILPLSQLGIIKAEETYFPPNGRPYGKTHYYLFSISSEGRKIVNSAFERLCLQKKLNVFMDKYTLRLLCFIIHLLVQKNALALERVCYWYDDFLEEKYGDLAKEPRIAQLLNEFKQDVQKHECGFLIRGYKSRSIFGETYLVLIPEFVDSLRQLLPVSSIEKEARRFKLVRLMKASFLNPPPSKEWYEEFLRKVEVEKMQEIFEEWSKELESQGVLIKNVVLQANELRAFLDRKIEEIQQFFLSGSEEGLEEFLKILEQKNVGLNEEDKVDILSPCESRQEFSNFISSVYKVLHDQLKIKNDYIDAIRCYFHHKKKDEQQKYYEEKFREFCEKNQINWPPKDEDDWRRLKTHIVKQAVTSLSN